MNRIFTLISIFSVVAHFAIAQCTPDGSVTTEGFMDDADYPCLVNGVAFSEAVQFKIPENFQFGGTEAEVRYVIFEEIVNLPCSTSHSLSITDTFFGGADGCFTISGTTVENAGQFELGFRLIAGVTINGNDGEQNVDPDLAKDVGFSFVVRVKQNEADACPEPNASSSRDACTDVSTSIEDINQFITDVTVNPNPVNTIGAVSFYAKETSNIDFTVLNVLGREVISKSIVARAGSNEIEFDASELSRGIYLYNLNIEGKRLTKRFMVK